MSGELMLWLRLKFTRIFFLYDIQYYFDKTFENKFVLLLFTIFTLIPR